MYPNFCGGLGFAGWIAMLAIWGGLVALVVWGVAKLFPERPRPPANPAGLSAPSQSASSRWQGDGEGGAGAGATTGGGDPSTMGGDDGLGDR